MIQEDLGACRGFESGREIPPQGDLVKPANSDASGSFPERGRGNRLHRCRLRLQKSAGVFRGSVIGRDKSSWSRFGFCLKSKYPCDMLFAACSLSPFGRQDETIPFLHSPFCFPANQLVGFPLPGEPLRSRFRQSTGTWETAGLGWPAPGDAFCRLSDGWQSDWWTSPTGRR